MLSRNRQTMPPPVTRVDVRERQPKHRAVLLAVLILTAAAAFGYGIWSGRQVDPGWVEVIDENAGADSAAGDLTFLYELEKGTSTAAYREVVNIYHEACIHAYRLFDVRGEYEDIEGMGSLNRHPNEKIRIEDDLYEALERAVSGGSRYLYLGPVYEQYSSIFYSTEEGEASQADPFTDPQAEAFCQQAAAFAGDPRAIDLQFLGEGEVLLTVSEDYLAFLTENDCHVLLDFGWMENAFIVDYLAREYITRRYTQGVISSRDGFVRCLDERDTGYSLPFYQWEDGEPEPACDLSYHGPLSAVVLMARPVQDLPEDAYYLMEDGSVRNAYIDPADGLCRTAFPELAVWSDKKTCGEIAAAAAPVWIRETPEDELLKELNREGIGTVYEGEDGLVFYDPTESVYITSAEE